MNKLIAPLALLFIVITFQLSYAEEKTVDQKLIPIGLELNIAHQNLQKTAKRLNDMNLPSLRRTASHKSHC